MTNTTKGSKRSSKTSKSDLNGITVTPKKPTSTTRTRSRSVAQQLKELPFDKFMNKYASEIAAWAKTNQPEYKNLLIAKAIEAEPDTLFTAKHFVEKLRCSPTRVYNIMREMAAKEEIRMIQTPTKHVYYTSIRNKNITV